MTLTIHDAIFELPHIVKSVLGILRHSINVDADKVSSHLS